MINVDENKVEFKYPKNDIYRMSMKLAEIAGTEKKEAERLYIKASIYADLIILFHSISHELESTYDAMAIITQAAEVFIKETKENE